MFVFHLRSLEPSLPTAHQLVEVVLPVPLESTFSYRHILQDENETLVQPGDLVAVPFGRRKKVIGLVIKVSELNPETKKIDGFVLKNITRVFPPEYRLENDRLKLARWIASFYALDLGQVVLFFIHHHREPKFGPPEPKLQIIPKLMPKGSS